MTLSEKLSQFTADLKGYAAKGLTVTDVEDRVLRACKTLRAIPDPDKRFRVMHNAWPEIVRSAEDAYGYTDAMMPRFKPTPADISDMLTALAWTRVLDKQDFRLVWSRSFGYSFRQIGLRLNRHDETIRRWYKDAMLRVWQAANAAPVASGSSARSGQG